MVKYTVRNLRPFAVCSHSMSTVPDGLRSFNANYSKNATNELIATASLAHALTHTELFAVVMLCPLDVAMGKYFTHRDNHCLLTLSMPRKTLLQGSSPRMCITYTKRPLLTGYLCVSGEVLAKQAVIPFPQMLSSFLTWPFAYYYHEHFTFEWCKVLRGLSGWLCIIIITIISLILLLIPL